MFEAIKGILRAVLGALGGYLVGKGIIDEGTMSEIIGAVTVIVTGVWSVVDKHLAKKKLEKAIAAPAGKAE